MRLSPSHSKNENAFIAHSKAGLETLHHLVPLVIIRDLRLHCKYQVTHLSVCKCISVSDFFDEHSWFSIVSWNKLPICWTLLCLFTSGHNHCWLKPPSRFCWALTVALCTTSQLTGSKLSITYFARFAHILFVMRKNYSHRSGQLRLCSFFYRKEIHCFYKCFNFHPVWTTSEIIPGRWYFPCVEFRRFPVQKP